MGTLDKEKLKKVQKIDLQMAEYFVSFCQENHLLCYFCGGGCIGAVRHKGFIPWDDDLDFFMPRSDYEQLKKIWIDTDRYALRYPKENYNDHNIFITLRDKETTMIKTYQKDMDIIHGISIDIFPLDGCPDRKLNRISQLFWALLFQLFCAQLVPENHGGMIAFIGKISLGVLRGNRTRYWLWKKAEEKMSQYDVRDCNYITELCAGPKYMFNKYPRDAFGKAIFLDFEDTTMPVPIGYDDYLKIAFGDYMELPELKDQKPSHDAVIVDPDHSFLKYIDDIKM